MKKVITIVLFISLIVCSGCSISKTSEGSVFSAPANITTKNSLNGVTISWDAVKGMDNSKCYRILRKTEDSNWTRIGSTQHTSFVDKTVSSGIKYFYSVAVVDAKKSTMLSEYDKEGKGITFYAVPQINTVISSANGNTISWSPVAGMDDNKCYRILRKTENGEWERIGSTKNNSYTDAEIETNKNYYYAVAVADAKRSIFLSAYDTKGYPVTD